MKKRIAMAAAAAAAALAIPLAGATTAQASAAFHFQGAYPSYADCEQAGQNGALLWGPVFLCVEGLKDDTGRQWYNLLVH